MHHDIIRNNNALFNTLNELVRINYDRVLGYEKISGALGNIRPELKIALKQSLDISRGFITYWQQTIRAMGHEPLSSAVLNSRSGGLDFPAARYQEKDMAKLIQMCHEKEQKVIAAYDDVLPGAINLPNHIADEISRQKQKIQDFLKTLKIHSIIT